MKVDHSLGDDLPENLKIPETGSSAEEKAEGIFIKFVIPKDTNAYELYIDGIGLVTENYGVKNTTEDDFFYPFVTPNKEYTIRVKFLKEEVEKDGWCLGRPDDGIIGWFDVTAKAGEDSKGEVRLTSKGIIDVKKNGEFKFTKKPAFQNEDLLGDDWKVEIGLVEGISWMYGAERRTKWHSMAIPKDDLTKSIDLYQDQKSEGTEYSIDFICVRPIMNYPHEGKTYRYQWDSFVRDIYYPPIENPDLINGIYVEYPVVKEEEYSRCDVYIDGIGKVAEMGDDSINFLDDNKKQASFFYPFVEPGEKYTVRFSFKRPELKDGDFTIYTPNETICEDSYTVTVGAKSKGEVRLTSKGKVDAASTKQGNFKFTEKPEFKNEDLLGDDWQIELGLIEGISWEHEDERRTLWHDSVKISKDKLETETNFYEHVGKNTSIDCICVRPILLNYEYKGKKYSYQWDGFVHDIYYPLRNPDGIYVELDLPKKPFSQCDVTIDGIGKVAEGVTPLEENPARASFFYPFLEPNKDYTIHFSFKKPEPVDSEGFTIPISGSDALLPTVDMEVTAGVRSKGEVRMENVGYLKADSNCKIILFQKPTFENEELLGNDWMIEIGLMEGISWNHGDERRTKWHCAVKIHPNDTNVTSKNLRDLEMSPGYNPCEHDHDIDCICVRPIMYYEYDGKEYKYMWDGNAYDVHYPLNADFQEIDINDPADVAKIIGTWTQNEEVDYETEHSLAKVHVVWNETLVIDDTNVHNSYICTYTKANGGPFTKQEIIDEFCDDYLSNDLPDNYIDFEVGEFYNDWELEWNPNPTMYIYKIYQIHPDITLFKDWRTITDKYERTETLSDFFENINNYEYNYFRTCELKLSKDGSQLYIFWTDKDDEHYDEWTDIYKRQ